MLFILRTIFPFILVITIPLLAMSHGTPTKIAGIEIGTNVDDYPNIEHTNYLKEVVVMEWHGFRKGIISYGICHSPGVIVKIRMKYEDSSKDFFDILLKKYKKNFGSPDEWKGDSFGIKHIWKWKFKDKEGKIVHMILQHNLQDLNDNIGNEVKLFYPEMIENERLCFIRKCEEISTPEQKNLKEQLKDTGWDYLIPK